MPPTIRDPLTDKAERLLGSFPRRLRQAIDDKSEGNVASFAREIDTDYSTVSQWLSDTGDAFPSARTLARIRVAFKIDLNWLLLGN